MVSQAVMDPELMELTEWNRFVAVGNQLTWDIHFFSQHSKVHGDSPKRASESRLKYLLLCVKAETLVIPSRAFHSTPRPFRPQIILSHSRCTGLLPLTASGSPPPLHHRVSLCHREGRAV